MAIHFFSICSLGWAAAIAATPLSHPAQLKEAAAVEKVGPVQISGYLDVSYNTIGGKNAFSDGASHRSFDVQQNGARWQQLALIVADQPKEGWGGLLNVTMGHDADVVASFGTNGGYNGQSKLVDVSQGFIQYARGPWTAVAGKFITLAGQEYVDSRVNWNFSHSILFTAATPGTHTGLRLCYAPEGSNLSYTAGINNGWDDLNETNSSKTIEAGVSLVASPKLTISAQAYRGREQVQGLSHDGPSGNRDLIDVILTYKPNVRTTAVLNYDYGRQDNASTVVANDSDSATWSGLAGYVNYKINPKWNVTLRAEAFDDHDGYRTGIVQKWQEGTLTLGYTPDSAWEFRIEGRVDSSNVASFLKKDGASASKTLSALGIQALYKF